MLIDGAIDMIILLLGDSAVVELAVDGLRNGVGEDELAGIMNNVEG